jgi:hypothetical protein
VNKTTLLITGLLGALLARPAAGEGRDLLVHGAAAGGEAPGLWMCRVEPRDAKLERSVLIERDRTQEGLWSELTQIPSRIALLTNDDAELVVVMAPARAEAFARDWAWVSPTRFTYGPALPGGGRIAAMAGGAKGLWALGASAGAAEPPTSRPATLPTTVPSTRPSGSGLALYQFKGQWKAVPAAWPAELSVLGIGDVSMLALDDAVYVAARTRGNAIQVMKLDRDRWAMLELVIPDITWTMLKDVEKPETPRRLVKEFKPPRYFKLLSLLGKRAMWIQPGDAEVDPSGLLWTPESQCSIEMPQSQGKIRAAAMDLVIVRDQPRLYYLSEDKTESKLNEQAFNVNGKFVGKAQQIVYARKQSGTELNWITITVMAVLTIVILNLVLRRRSGEADEGRDADD